jgi:predicted naringenin-chalcone synthase
MNKEIFIHSLCPVLPQFHLPQNIINDWIMDAHKLSETETPDENLKRFCLSERYISQRYFECSDVNDQWDEHQIYKLPEGATIEERTKFFGNRAVRVFEEFYGNQVPEHIIHVTCTGYLSPSPAQKYFNRGKSPGITHAYHMGCYASLPSIRMAMGLHLSLNTEIDVVHTEMCSLHLNPKLHTPEQMVVQTLFADGHIKYSVGESSTGLRILSIKEKLLPDSSGDMTWIPGPDGMMMTLSKEVPFKIRDALPAFVKELCEESGVQEEDMFLNGLFAIHPGGPKIIEAVQKKLELQEHQVQHSQSVLFNRGNMSSATLPHVWHEMLKDAHNGQKILSLAFGPGLTIFGSIFEVRK